MSRRAPARAPLVLRLTIACTLAALLPPATARAKVSLQGGGTASAAWTDNILNAPNEQIPGGAPRESDFFFQLGPKLILSAASPQLLQRLSYTFTTDLFVHHSEANSYSNQLDWTANLTPTPRSLMLLSLASTEGKVSTFTFDHPSADVGVGVQPQNSNTDFFNQRALEHLEHSLTGFWRLSQSLRLSFFVPLERGRLPDSYEVYGDLGVERLFKLDALGLVARVDFVEFVQPRNPVTNVAAPNQSQVLTGLVARWRRDWSRSWSTEAALGVVGVVAASDDPNQPTGSAWRPSALAALRWTRDIGSAELRYTHDATPNALTGNTFDSDSVTLQGGVAVVPAKMFFGATVGYSHSRLLALSSTAAGQTANVVVTDVTVGWQPLPILGVFARYSLLDQFGYPPMGDVPALLPNIKRNTVMLGINVLYPERTAAPVATRASTRVDQNDQPMFPEVHAPEPKQ
jgi:hypothetical protein